MLIKQNCCFLQPSSNPVALNFSDAFIAINDEAIPFGSGPYLLASYLDEWCAFCPLLCVNDVFFVNIHVSFFLRLPNILEIFLVIFMGIVMPNSLTMNLMYTYNLDIAAIGRSICIIFSLTFFTTCNILCLIFHWNILIQ